MMRRGTFTHVPRARIAPEAAGTFVSAGADPSCMITRPGHEQVWLMVSQCSSGGCGFWMVRRDTVFATRRRSGARWCGSGRVPAATRVAAAASSSSTSPGHERAWLVVSQCSSDDCGFWMPRRDTVFATRRRSGAQRCGSGRVPDAARVAAVASSSMRAPR